MYFCYMISDGSFAIMLAVARSIDKKLSYYNVTLRAKWVKFGSSTISNETYVRLYFVGITDAVKFR